MNRRALALVSNLALVGLLALAFGLPQQNNPSTWKPSWRPATEAEERQHRIDRLVEQMQQTREEASR